MSSPARPRETRPAEIVPLAPPAPGRFDQLTRSPHFDVSPAERLLRHNRILTIAGPPGAGKSELARQLALQLAWGSGAFLGEYPIARPATVLVIDEDNGADEELDRDEGILSLFELERREISNYYRLSLEGLLLDEPSWQSYLRTHIEALQIEVLFLDPISAMHKGKETRDECRPVVLFLRSLLRQFPTLSIVLVHHTRKLAPGAPTIRGIDDVRGGVWHQESASVAMVSPLGDRRVKWDTSKRVPPSSLILEQQPAPSGAGPFVCVADGSTSTKRATADDRVLACIDAGATSIDEITAATGIPKRTAWDAIKRLRMAAILTPKGSLARASEGLS